MPLFSSLLNVALAAFIAALAATAGGEFVDMLVLEDHAARQGNGTLSGTPVKTSCGLVEQQPESGYSGGDISCREKTGGCTDEEEFHQNGKFAKSLASISNTDDRFSSCAELCCKEPLCKSFSIDAKGVCYPKTAGAHLWHNKDSMSGRLKEKKPGDNTCTHDFSMISGYNLAWGDLNCRRDLKMARCPPGSDPARTGLLSFAVSGSPEEKFHQCAAKCCQYKACEAFTANDNERNGHCYLKGFGYEVMLDSTMWRVSGMKHAPKRKEEQCAGTKFSNIIRGAHLCWADVTCRELIGGCDYNKYPLLKRRWWDNLAAFKIAGTLEQRYEQCAALCCAQPQACKAFTFTATECFLKKKSGWWKAPDGNWDAGVIVEPSPSAHPTPHGTPSPTATRSETAAPTPSVSPSEGASPSVSPSNIVQGQLIGAMSELGAIVEAEKAVKAAESSYTTAKARYDRIAAAIKAQEGSASGDASSGEDHGDGKPSSKGYNEKLAALEVVEHRLVMLNNAKKLLQKIREIAESSPVGASKLPKRERKQSKKSSDGDDGAEETGPAADTPQKPASVKYLSVANSAPLPQPAKKPQPAKQLEGMASGAATAVKSWFGKLFRFGQTEAGAGAKVNSLALAEEWQNALSGLEGLKEALAGDAEVDVALEGIERDVVGSVGGATQHSGLRAGTEARGERASSQQQMVLQPY
jgi:PAN domain